MKNYTFNGLNMQPVNSFAEAVDLYKLGFSVPTLDLFYNDPRVDKEALRKELLNQIKNQDVKEAQKTLQKIFDAAVATPYNVQVIHGNSYNPIAVVGLGYTPVEYPIALGFAEDLLTAGAKIVGGGCPNRGERAYLVLEGEEKLEVAPGNFIRNRYLLSSSHDGTGKIELRMTPWWPETGVAITPDATHPLSFKHTKNVNLRMNQAKKVFKKVNNNWDEFKTGAQKMLKVKLTEGEAKDFIAHVLPTSSKGEASTRLENLRSEILTIWRDTGIGTRLPQCRGTLFGLVQAVAEWSDIKRTVRKSKKRDDITAALDAKLMRDSAKKKQTAWAMALYLAKNKKLSGALSNA